MRSRSALLILSLFGWASVRTGWALRASILLARLRRDVALLARADTFYWALIPAPLSFAGLAFLPKAAADLAKAVRPNAISGAMSRILLIVGGGIAAYKAAELIRLLRKEGHSVTPVLTEGGSHFVTPMSLAALAESPVYTSLWDLKDEAEMGHIQLSRAADLVLVAPATADLLARMAAGEANDLATTLLLATDKPVVVAPAMNVRMWQHAATRRNIEQLKADGITVLEPDEGPMACGEFGPGRLPEPADIYARIKPMLGASPMHRYRPSRGALGGQACAGHRRPDARADRSGAGDRQPLVGQAGVRHRRRRRPGRRPRDADRRAGVAADAGRRGADRRRDRPANGRRGRSTRCRPTSRSWSPRSPTGRSKPRRPSSRSRDGPPQLKFAPNPGHPRHARRASRPPDAC